MNNDALGQRPMMTSIEQDMISRSSSQTPQGTAAWSQPGPTSNMGSFEFTPTSNDISVPSFDPAIAAFADMSFAQPGAYQNRDMHDKKRMKLETETPALDSIDYWIQFDDDADKMGSFEIDYSRRPDLNQKVGMSTDSLPGLGSGLYSTTMAPFKEDDFIDDSAFEQTFSEDEEMFESTTDIGRQTSQMDDFQTSQPSSEQADRVMGVYGSPQGMDKFQPGLRLASTGLKDVPRQMRRDLWGSNPSDLGQQNLDNDEQRRLLEAAMDTGKMPGTMIPPNGFGVGFGAGLGVPPQEFETTPASTSSQQTKSATKSRRASDASENSEAKKQSRRASTATKTSVATGTAKKSPSSGPAPKARSADRIAHNDVERKYRTNLKDKIAELRAAVPALQGVGGDVESEGGTVTPSQAASKVSKGTVLTKATEYIHQLEARNRAMAQEHQQLARRLQAFETLLNGNGRHPDMMMQPNHSMQLFDPRGFC